MNATSKFTGETKLVRWMDPVFDTLDGQRARFVRVVDSTSIELADNEGNVLPDYRHPSQVLAY
jgi:hypothetical protein